MSVSPSATCDDCGSPLEPGQRYCLGCGARVGARSPELVALLQRLRQEQAAEVKGADPEPVRSAPRKRAPLGSGLRLPAPWVSALLVFAFLGFGVVIGGAASTRVNATLASSSAPLRVVLPQTTASAAPTTTSSSEPPPTGEATSTPTASASEPSTSTPAVSTASTSSKSSTNSSGSGGGSSGGESGSAGSEGGSSGSEGASSGSSGSSGSPSKPPPVKHVFVIMLAEQPSASVFGPASTAPYLSRTLEQRGELLVRYYGVAHQGLADGIALLSGQGPTVQTAEDCPTYMNVEPGAVGADQQVSGSGCVYPGSTQTLAGQLTAKHLTWRAYLEGMDEPGAVSGACAHPALGQADPTSAKPPPAGQAYATSRNPFVYFQSLTGSPSCAADDVGLRQLSSDLSNPKRTPNFSYIVPDRCHDASSTPCAPGATAGPAAADGFLQKVVPEITSSKAYKENGLLVITVDEAPATGPNSDSSSCCGQPQFPNLPAPATVVKGLPSKGGGEVGALLLSPYVKGGATNQEQYNHYSLLRTIEDLFALKHLGYAGLSGVSSFNSSVFSAYKAG